ncbi:hypothetical protein AGMMS49938_06960 [Fibrobacterales bacterium]|nr:hypothetical protein AGMMS49938_06960 [Fibrobacterales bacterium]
MAISEKLNVCKTEEQVESVFGEFKISEPKKKNKELLKCMGNPKVFRTYGNPTNWEQEYCFTLKIFLLQKWRVNELFDKLGF